MKKYTYLIVACMLSTSFDIVVSRANLLACPRCRRAEPKGPRQRPHPGFPSARPSQNKS